MGKYIGRYDEGKTAILLIDEYDVPLVKASDYGYYEDLIEVMRVILGK